MKKHPLAALSFAALMGFSFFAFAQKSPDDYYKYIHNDGEYSVMLPEAPRVKTIWAEAGNIPYLDSPPTEGAIGEIATFRRVDIAREDVFEVRITFLKADKKFLENLTEEKMKESLIADYQNTPLENMRAGYSENATKTLKWATIGGFSIDKKTNRPYYNAEHYLSGKQSILVVQVRYNVENREFGEYYRKLSENITYQAM